jgi:hypothetical protein
MTSHQAFALSRKSIVVFVEDKQQQGKERYACGVHNIQDQALLFYLYFGRPILFRFPYRM